jgi:hypothetical protein
LCSLVCFWGVFGGGTGDFNPADVEGFMILDDVVCHGTILSPINRQLGKVLQLQLATNYNSTGFTISRFPPA